MSNLINRLKGLARNKINKYQKSYSQCGEDLIISHLLRVIGITKPVYLDLGAHHPTYLSNTYYFYQNGSAGVCIEADPSLIKPFNDLRRRDLTVNCGVGTENTSADFYLMSSSTLNTFSKEEAQRYSSYGKQKIEKVIKIEMKKVDSIIESYCPRCPDLISLDVEGLDYLILQNYNFEKFRPAVFCIETLSYTEDKTERKLTEIIKFMNKKGYLSYADTYINTIFVEETVWQSRLK